MESGEVLARSGELMSCVYHVKKGSLCVTKVYEDDVIIVEESLFANLFADLFADLFPDLFFLR
tara:strand:+ start:594 stop:782 length:189 start_codon:yes stop_codon:yes gene_type:complete